MAKNQIANLFIPKCTFVMNVGFRQNPQSLNTPLKKFLIRLLGENSFSVYAKSLVYSPLVFSYVSDMTPEVENSTKACYLLY